MCHVLSTYVGVGWEILRNYRLGELFCGPGGLGLGAQHADIGNGDKITHVWATDYDADTCNTYIKNIEGASDRSVICEDIRELDYSRLKEISGIDGLAFGFPCNDFSIVGERKGISGEFGPLYKYGVKALEIFQPQWFIAENVGGLRSNNAGKAFERIMKELRGAGYEIIPNLYKFEQYGVPQARHRIIVVGMHKDLKKTFKVPSAEPYKHVDVSVSTALAGNMRGLTGTEKTRQSSQVVERLKHIKPGQNAFTADLPARLQINTRTRISQIYRRLDPDKPAYTVTGSGGGGTHMYHWDEPRALTNRERARLQTFPDDFDFCGSKEKVRRQIGMAVPPKGAQVIFEAILKTMAGVEYEWQEPSLK
ncbi:DNA cytosine methyltransferase [Actinomyces sp. HMSC065F11]|uniref:DNA cytosine methyltransferase n=1 Tax=Actinomyces sp. HMSC065F11 TaxID=1739395 RepID=UPI0008A25FDB|nr:DNA (cytosine-5-)-methyltransferase [Actinomyces sp. HMSC065F11]OFR31479.1 DNA cytosine methyltransferase [Actinomyces sp. HMSC065F11]